MPIMFVNPARKAKRRKVRTMRKRRARGPGGRFVSATRKRRRVKKRHNTSKGSSMAKTKRRRKTRSKSRVAKRRSAARGRATRRRKARKLSAQIMLGLRKNRRRKRKNAPRKRRRNARRRTVRRRRNLLSFAQPNRRRKRRRNRARKTTRRRRRNSYFTLAANPRRRRRKRRNSYFTVANRRRKRRGRRMNRARRRYGRRRNPALMSLAKQILPIAASLYGARLLSGKVADKIPGMDMIPAQFQGVALAGILGVAGHFATNKVAMLKKYRTEIMIGLGINFLDKLVKALSPDAAAMFGVSEYVAVGGMGYAPPLDDQITMGEYVGVGNDFQEALGVEQDLGLEQDLGVLQADMGFGDVGDNNLGGVRRDSMLAPVKSMKFLAPVPPRSFTGPVPGFGAQFDEASSMYQGIFAGRDSYGGWGDGSGG